MRRMQLLAGLCWGAVLWSTTGCINQTLDPSRMSPEALMNVPDHQLCLSYSQNRTPALRAELKRRKTFTAREWQAIDTYDVFVGMSEMALLTALPGVKCTHTLRTKGVIAKEWYFARLTDVLIRTENGKVVSFK